MDFKGIVLREPTEEEQNEWARKRFAVSGPFNIENWPQELLAISIQTVLFPLFPHEVQALIDAWAAMADSKPLSQGAIVTLQCLASRIDPPIAELGSAFVRLGSVSSKDDLSRLGDRLFVTNGVEAVDKLTGSMERIYEHLAMERRAGHQTHICVRPFLEDLCREYEFRCLIEDGKIVGISQYFYMDFFPGIGEIAEKLEEVIKTYLLEKVMPQAPWPSFVADVIVAGDFDPILLEINPPVSARLTDPCLFSDGDLDGSFRWVKEPIPEE